MHLIQETHFGFAKFRMMAHRDLAPSMSMRELCSDRKGLDLKDSMKMQLDTHTADVISVLWFFTGTASGRISACDLQIAALKKTNHGDRKNQDS